MGLFSKYDYRKGDNKLRWGTILWTVGIALIVLILLTAVPLLAATKISVKTLFTKEGITNAFNDVTKYITTFVSSVGTFVKDVIVSVIVALPLIAFGRLDIIDKEDSFLWVVVEFLLLASLLATKTPIKSVIAIAWLANCIILLIAASDKQKSMRRSRVWLIFGLMSALFAPVGSVLNNVLALQILDLNLLLRNIGTWLILSLAGLALTSNSATRTSTKYWKKTKSKIKPMIGSIWSLVGGYWSFCKNQIVVTNKLAKAAKNISASLTKANQTLQQGNLNSAQQTLSSLVPIAENLENFEVIDFQKTNGLGSQINEIVLAQKSNLEKIKTTLNDVGAFNDTNLGKARDYLREIGARISPEMKTGKWPEFMKLRDNNFKEVSEILQKTGNKKLARRGTYVEAHAKTTGIKQFAKLILDCVHEIDHQRAEYQKEADRCEKNLEKSRRVATFAAHKVDALIAEILEKAESLKKYDLQAKDQIRKLVEDLRSANDPKIIREELAAKIEDMNKNADSITEYFSNREKELKNIEKMIANAEDELDPASENTEQLAEPASNINHTLDELIGEETA